MYLEAIMDTFIYLYRPQHLITFRKRPIFRKQHVYYNRQLYHFPFQ